jgi:glucose-1-phosphate adenylyltransferase
MMGASSGATIRNSVVMGNDLYQDESPPKPGAPSIGTGRNAVIEGGAIIDKNAWIGNELVITPEGKPANIVGHNYYIRDGVLVVPKNAVIRTSI